MCYSVAGYSRLGGGMAGLSSSMYPASYPASDQAAGPYPAISMENSAFYPSLVSASVSVRIHDDPGLQSRGGECNLFIGFILAIKLGCHTSAPPHQHRGVHLDTAGGGILYTFKWGNLKTLSKIIEIFTQIYKINRIRYINFKNEVSV